MHPYESPYTGMRNNPVLFIDPDGRTVYVGGELCPEENEERTDDRPRNGLEYVYSLVPYSARTAITMQDDGKIIFDMNKVPQELHDDGGVQLLNGMSNSPKNYLFRASTDVVVRSQSVDPKTGDPNNVPSGPVTVSVSNNSGISNLSEQPLKQPLKGKNGNTFYSNYSVPGEIVPGTDKYFDAQLTINPNAEYFEKSGGQIFPKTTESIVFHEAGEAFNRTDLQQNYLTAHQNSNDAERAIKRKDSSDSRTSRNQGDPGVSPKITK